MFIMHDHPTSAHFAIETTFNRIREKYYWPKMYEDIKLSELRHGRSEKIASRIAAATVNKVRSMHGDVK